MIIIASAMKIITVTMSSNVKSQRESELNSQILGFLVAHSNSRTHHPKAQTDMIRRKEIYQYMYYTCASQI